MKYFTLYELTNSHVATRKGIDNSPSDKVAANLTALVDNVLDPLRKVYGKPIVVTSGYRCASLNKLVGGAAKSQHLYGQAADIRSVSDSPRDNKALFDLIIKLHLPFDQLIDEYGYNWVHVSYSSVHNRKQVLHVK